MEMYTNRIVVAVTPHASVDVNRREFLQNTTKCTDSVPNVVPVKARALRDLTEMIQRLALSARGAWNSDPHRGDEIPGDGVSGEESNCAIVPYGVERKILQLRAFLLGDKFHGCCANAICWQLYAQHLPVSHYWMMVTEFGMAEKVIGEMHDKNMDVRCKPISDFAKQLMDASRILGKTCKFAICQFHSELIEYIPQIMSTHLNLLTKFHTVVGKKKIDACVNEALRAYCDLVYKFENTSSINLNFIHTALVHMLGLVEHMSPWSGWFAVKFGTDVFAKENTEEIISFFQAEYIMLLGTIDRISSKLIGDVVFGVTYAHKLLMKLAKITYGLSLLPANEFWKVEEKMRKGQHAIFNVYEKMCRKVDADPIILSTGRTFETIPGGPLETGSSLCATSLIFRWLIGKAFTNLTRLAKLISNLPTPR
jgi:hypothetical protein